MTFELWKKLKNSMVGVVYSIQCFYIMTKMNEFKENGVIGMRERQNIEWKESWRDEYLKWICGFANAQGGKIYIGTRDDGTVVGIQNAKRLLDDLPNKIQNKLGIVADVNLLKEGEREYIEIIVNPWSFPVNYEGEYYYRSVSTKQLLRGNALTSFLMEKTGLKWMPRRLPMSV